MSASRGGDMARTVILPTLAHSSSSCWWYFLANLMNSRLPTSSPNLSRFWLMRGLILTPHQNLAVPQGQDGEAEAEAEAEDSLETEVGDTLEVEAEDTQKVGAEDTP